MQRHLKGDFYRQNIFAFEKFLLKDNIIDYFKIFENENVFVVDGTQLIDANRKRKNVKQYKDADY